MIYQQDQRWADALSAFDRALEKGHPPGEIHLRMGEIYDETGRYDQAQAYFERALDANVDAARTHFKLGNVLQKTGQIAASIAHYEQALRLRPNYLGALYSLARAQFSLQQYDRAAEGLLQVVALDPDAFMGHLQLGMCYLRMGQAEKALTAFDRHWRCNPIRGRYLWVARWRFWFWAAKRMPERLI